LGPGGPLRLGGVEIPHDRALIGHSDADVLLHAVTDALLGAASLGDIGQLFPDTAAENQNRDSSEMLLSVFQQVVATGFSVVNLDCILFAEQPKLAPFSDAMRRHLAELLEIAPEAVGIKAKTGEGVGPVGKREAISAQCVVLLEGT
jgi:2-C-methyl-D-erythritol 2,4-cyclodiphosphate synthase